jgi:ABC-type molybdate transport system substrate-binding protein
MGVSLFPVAALVLLAGAVLAAVDLSRAPSRTVTVYTTPALRDVLEKDIVPRFEEASGYHVALVYVAAGQQYNRLRMSPGHEEADMFLHASPLYLEKGAAEGFFAPFKVAQDGAIPAALKGAAVEGGRVWYAFAWSPLVEVHVPTILDTPDLADTSRSFGFPHPRLSNNGVYATLLFENASRDAGANVLAHTVVQPVNARANIGGIADGSFEVTLGYEAVTRFYQDQGARLAYDLPLIAGQRVTTPVLCVAGLVKGGGHPGAVALLSFLFEDTTQSNLAKFHFRASVNGTAAAPEDFVSLDGARVIDYDWARWADLEEALARYVVTT